MSSDDEDVPAIEVLPRRMAPRPIDDIARARYLEELARSGSHLAASAAARPHLSRSKRSAADVMRGHMESNPEFAAMCRDVLSHLGGRLQNEAVRRALEGVVVYVRKDERGNVVEERRQYDNDLLLKMLREIGRRVDPTILAPEEKTIKVTGGVMVAQANMDLENMMENMSSEAIREMMAASEKARLGSGEVADDDGDVTGADLVGGAIQAAEKREDDGFD